MICVYTTHRYKIGWYKAIRAFQLNECSCHSIQFEMWCRGSLFFANVWSTLMNSSACDLVSLSSAFKTEPACVRLIHFSTWDTLSNHKQAHMLYPNYAMTTCYRSVKKIVIGLSHNYIHSFWCLIYMCQAKQFYSSNSNANLKTITLSIVNCELNLYICVRNDKS